MKVKYTVDGTAGEFETDDIWFDPQDPSTERRAMDCLANGLRESSNMLGGDNDDGDVIEEQFDLSIEVYDGDKKLGVKDLYIHSKGDDLDIDEYPKQDYMKILGLDDINEK